jgi:hypothetical protein
VQDVAASTRKRRPSSQSAILRAWAIANLAIFLVVVVPGLLGYPYPANVRRYVQWGGLGVYVLSSLLQLFVVARRSSK